MVRQDGGHNTSTSVAPNNVADKFAEMAKDHFTKLLQMSDRISAVISFRVPASVKAMYTVLPPEVKWAIRRTIVEMIEQSFNQVSKHVSLINININNNINLNLAKAEAKVDVKIDVSSVLAELDELKKMIYSWHRHGAIPKAAVKNATARIKNIEKMIKGVN